MHRIIAAAAALSIVGARTACAQDDFAGLKLKVGSNIRITEDGLTLEGPLASVSPDRVTVGGREVRPGPALKIERDRGHTGLKGMAIGAGVGAALGLAAAHGEGWGVLGMFPGAFWGGLIGVAMDRYVPVYDTTSFAAATPQLSVPDPLPAASTPIFAGMHAKVGDRVFVTQEGITVTGAISALSPSRLVVGSHEFAAGTALKIERDGDPIWDGAVTGILAGVLLGACSGCNDGQHTNVLASGLVWGGVGALIDWAHHGRTTIHDSTSWSSTRTARLVPLVDPHRRGVALSVTR